MTTKEMAVKICEALSDKKGRDVLMLAVEHMTIIADYFVIASGNSVPQVQALSDAVEECAQEMGLSPRRSAGYREGRWVIQDLGTWWSTFSTSRSASFTTWNACGRTATTLPGLTKTSAWRAGRGRPTSMLFS